MAILLVKSTILFLPLSAIKANLGSHFRFVTGRTIDVFRFDALEHCSMLHSSNPLFGNDRPILIHHQML
jgi:hypothetical protein